MAFGIPARVSEPTVGYWSMFFSLPIFFLVFPVTIPLYRAVGSLPSKRYNSFSGYFDRRCAGTSSCQAFGRFPNVSQTRDLCNTCQSQKVTPVLGVTTHLVHHGCLTCTLFDAQSKHCGACIIRVDSCSHHCSLVC